MTKNNTTAYPALREQTITSPWMFCKVMERRPDLARRILAMMLGKDHGTLTCVEDQTEDMWNIRTGERTGICFKAEDNTWIDLELREEYEPILEHVSMHQNLQLYDAKRKQQKTEKSSIGTAVAMIFLENPFEDSSDDPLACSPVTVAIHEPDKDTTITSSGIMISLLNVDGSEDKAPAGLRSLILFLRNRKPCDELTALLEEEVHSIQNDPEIIQGYDKEMKARMEAIHENCMRLAMDMVKDHLLPAEDAARVMNVSLKELKQRMMN